MKLIYLFLIIIERLYLVEFFVRFWLILLNKLLFLIFLEKFCILKSIWKIVFFDELCLIFKDFIICLKGIFCIFWIFWIFKELFESNFLNDCFLLIFVWIGNVLIKKLIKFLVFLILWLVNGVLIIMLFW